MRKLVKRLMLPGALVAASPYGSAAAQEATHPARAADCQAQAQIVSSHRPDSLYAEAIGSMMGCDASGPPVLVTLWASTTIDAPTLAILEARMLIERTASRPQRYRIK